MTFGSAMVVDRDYFCWVHYVEVTGAASVTVERTTENRFWKE
tara:strand:- start:323 stop:448 length:126 start_codon:yes stop_codon:yes gene_type:complete